MDKKEEYIDRLLNVIKSLETNVSLAKKEDTLSFSFFRDSFKKGQEISKLIHELEMLQIEDMKRQMEKLIVFLSEEEDKKQTIESEIDNNSIVVPITSPAPTASNYNIEEQNNSVVEVEITSEDTDSVVANVVEKQKVDQSQPFTSTYTQTIELPRYVNPNASVSKEEDVVVGIKKEVEKEPTAIGDVIYQSNHSLSVNDTVQTAQPKVDVKRGLSLNDRFYFQRELFNNNREVMNSVMTDINSLNDREAIEQYLRENTSWNFENEDVKSFLDIVSKGLN